MGTREACQTRSPRGRIALAGAPWGSIVIGSSRCCKLSFDRRKSAVIGCPSFRRVSSPTADLRRNISTNHANLDGRADLATNSTIQGANLALLGTTRSKRIGSARRQARAATPSGVDSSSRTRYSTPRPIPSSRSTATAASATSTPLAGRSLDCASADVIGQHVFELIGNTRTAMPMRPTAPVAATRNCDSRAARRAGSPTPRSRWTEPSVGAVAYLRDETERRRDELRLSRQNDELEQTVRALAHDLRSPLVSVLGFSRLLREDFGAALGERGTHFLDRITEAGRTMESLIRDLLDFARIGHAGERRVLVDPREVLLQLRGELKPRLEQQTSRSSCPSIRRCCVAIAHASTNSSPT